MSTFVLYVAYDRTDTTHSRFCPGSRRAIEIIDNAGLQDVVMIQSVDVLREKVATLPTWLQGTPTLVDRQSKRAMRGSAALSHLQALASPQVDPAVDSATPNMTGMVAPNEAMHLGTESNFEPIQEDPQRYNDSAKVSDSDLQKLIERRKANIPQP